MKCPTCFLRLGWLLFVFFLTTSCNGRNFNFVPAGESDPKILMKAEFAIEIKAFEGGMVVAAWIGGSNDYSDLMVLGQQGRKSILGVHFPEDITWSIVMNEHSADRITIQSYVQFIPEKLFPPFDKLTYPVTFQEEAETTYHSVMKSFRCDTQMMKSYIPTKHSEGNVHFEIIVSVWQFQIQAYHIQNSEFSPAEHCAADQGVIPTQKPLPPLFPTTTLPPKIPGIGVPRHSFVVNNTVNNKTVKCISMEGRIGFDVSYDTYNGGYETSKQTVRIGIPNDVVVNGLCFYSDYEQVLSIRFLQNWVAEFVFSINEAASRFQVSGNYQSRLDYSIKSVSLKYNIDDEEKFPKAFKTEGTNFTINEAKTKDKFRKKTSAGFFDCRAEKTFKLSNDVSMVTSDFRFKAFIDDQDTGFYGMPGYCEEDMGTIGLPTLEVIVGCLVVTVSLVVVIAFVAIITSFCQNWERRYRRGYVTI